MAFWQRPQKGGNNLIDARNSTRIIGFPEKLIPLIIRRLLNAPAVTERIDLSILIAA